MPKFSRTLWNELHNLTSQESEIIKRFEADPNGPAFVAVADLLRKRGYLDESIVVLEEGLRKFPRYHSARAALARDYFHKGLLRESVTELDTVLSRSPDNLMAQRLRLRLALLFAERDEALERLKILKQLSPDDEFTRLTRGRLATEDWGAARNAVVAELERQGVKVDPTSLLDPSKTSEGALGATFLQADSLPAGIEGKAQLPPDFTSGAPARQVGGGLPARDDSLRVDTRSPFPGLDDTRLPAALSTVGSLASVRGDADRYLLLRGFRMVSPGAAHAEPSLRTDGEAASPLESTTLAGLYEAQGFHLKALDIYERLLKENPDDAALTRRASLAREAARAQLSARAGGSHLPPISTERETKLRRLERLLNRLEALP